MSVERIDYQYEEENQKALKKRKLKKKQTELKLNDTMLINL